DLGLSGDLSSASLRGPRQDEIRADQWIACRAGRQPYGSSRLPVSCSFDGKRPFHSSMNCNGLQALWRNPVEASRIGSSSNRPRIVLLVTVLILAAGAAAYWYWPLASEPVRARAPARPPVPVSVAVVRQQDQPVYVTGLGTVQASATIRVHTQ